MTTQRKLQISAICTTVTAFFLFGSSVLRLSRGAVCSSVLFLFATGFCVTGSFLMWRSYYRGQSDY